MRDLKKGTNPLLTKWLNCRGWIYQIENNVIVDKRTELAEEFAWGIPDSLVLAEIAKHSPIIEIGAGLGYWARLLQDRGCDVLPMDPFPPEQGTGWSKIFYGSFDQISRFKNRTLFCCWLPENIIKKGISEEQPEKLLWVGELIKLNGYKVIKEVPIPQWEGMNDKLYVFSKIIGE